MLFSSTSVILVEHSRHGLHLVMSSLQGLQMCSPDEDPMPMNGNPHPLPEQLLPNNNMFVVPQYPELGWDMAQHPVIPFLGKAQF